MRQNKRHLYTKSTPILVCCRQHTENNRNFKKHGITNIHNNAKAEVRPSESN